MPRRVRIWAAMALLCLAGPPAGRKQDAGSLALAAEVEKLG
jgi:hypothetical protein